MPKRKDINSILIIGAGPIVIGQACEFDYSGAQACKALREEGYRVILVNSNPATIMTDPEMADATYIEEVTKIEEQENDEVVLNADGKDELYNKAVEIIKTEGKASTSFLQRKLGIGYNRAARIIDQMEEEKIISPANHVGKREIY